MKSLSTYLSLFTFFFLLQSGHFAAAESNVIKLVLKNKKIALQSVLAYEGKEIKQVDEKVAVAFDFFKLTFEISGDTSGFDVSNIKVSVYNQNGNNCNFNGEPISPQQSLKKFLGQKLSDVAGADFSDNRFTNELVILIENIDGQLGQPIIICSQNIQSKKKPSEDKGSVEDDNIAAACENPVFYETYYISDIESRQTLNKSFFIIEHDFSSLNNGPQIFKCSYDANNKLNRVPKRALSVGKMATIFFQHYNPSYTKITNTLSFKNYNQENLSLFQSFIMLDSEKKTSKEDAGAKDKTAETTTDSSDPKLVQSLQNLQRDLVLFLRDIKEKSPNSLVVDRAILRVKGNIRQCFTSIESVSAAKIGSFFRGALPADSYSREIDSVVLLFGQIETYSMSVPPTIQISNSDEIISQVNYFVGDETSSSQTRTFNFPILGGLKLDFSTGFIFSSLVDKNYLIVDAPDKPAIDPGEGEEPGEPIKMKKIIEENGSKVQIGFGVLSHFYPRMSKWLSLGLTTGFLVKENLAVQFPIGGSILLGRESRFVLSGGAIFGERKGLSAKYNLNSELEATSLTNVTEDKLSTNRSRSGFFLAISYNLGGTNVGGK